MEFLHRYRRPFVGINAALIIIFGLAALIAPSALWGVVGIDVETFPLARVLAWSVESRSHVRQGRRRGAKLRTSA